MDHRDDVRAEVRDFLTTRRARITPDQAGLPSTGNRRVPGLRRSEVAMLAGLSVEYYARIERGQIAGASSGVLEALARALRLDETERSHLHDLARAADGIPTSGRSRRRTSTRTATRPGLAWTLEAITDGVAFVRDQHQDVLATNRLARAFYSPLVGEGGRLPNLARFHHPVVGEVTFAYEELAITAEPGHALIVYTAEPGSPSAERLGLLASWSARSAEPSGSAAQPAVEG